MGKVGGDWIEIKGREKDQRPAAWVGELCYVGDDG